jgi:predicted RNase H-like HicB family nuclease
VIYHQWNDGTWGACIPDIPDVLAVGETREEVAGAIHEALGEYAEGLRAEGRPLPAALHVADTVSAGESLTSVSVAR